jgi:hypothetical protein
MEKAVKAQKEIGKNSVFKILGLKRHFNSILKVGLALALFFIAAVFISGNGIIVEDGALNISNGLSVNTDTLFVDSTNGRVGIATDSPSQLLHIVGGSNPKFLIEDDTDDANDKPGFSLRSPAAANGGSWNFEVSNNGNFQIDFGPSSGAEMIFVDNLNTNSMVSATYRFGVNDTNPDYRLEARGKTGKGYFGITNNNDGDILAVDGSGNVGIGTAKPNQRLMVSGNVNVTGTIYYGALQANSPVLERTSDPFVAKCTVARDGKLVVEYIDNIAGEYQKIIEAVDPKSNNWWHRSCFEKNEKFEFLDSDLRRGATIEEIAVDDKTGEEITVQRRPTIEDVGFDWDTGSAFLQ